MVISPFFFVNDDYKQVNSNVVRPDCEMFVMKVPVLINSQKVTEVRKPTMEVLDLESKMLDSERR
jgi:hypothetical protein